MGATRLEAFSDGAIAILITTMVLELRIPHTADCSALRPLLPVFLNLRPELRVSGHLLAPVPTAAYGAVLLMAAVAYTILQAAILACPGRNPKLHDAIGSDRKGRLSIAALSGGDPARIRRPVDLVRPLRHSAEGGLQGRFIPRGLVSQVWGADNTSTSSIEVTKVFGPSRSKRTTV